MAPNSSKSVWDNPTFLNAFPAKNYDPSSASRLRRGFTVLLVPAVAAYAIGLIVMGQGDSTTTALSPANVYSKNNDAQLKGTPGKLVDKLWSTQIPSSAKTWPSIAADQMMPEVPLNIYVYGSSAQWATVSQSLGLYSRCESTPLGSLGTQYPNLNLREIEVGNTESGFSAIISTELGTAQTTATIGLTGSGPPVTHGPLVWPGGADITRSPGWGPTECDQCDSAMVR